MCMSTCESGSGCQRQRRPFAMRSHLQSKLRRRNDTPSHQHPAVVGARAGHRHRHFRQLGAAGHAVLLRSGGRTFTPPPQRTRQPNPTIDPAGGGATRGWRATDADDESDETGGECGRHTSGERWDGRLAIDEHVTDVRVQHAFECVKCRIKCIKMNCRSRKV